VKQRRPAVNKISFNLEKFFGALDSFKIDVEMFIGADILFKVRPEKLIVHVDQVEAPLFLRFSPTYK
jgi:hypothetical protein